MLVNEPAYGPAQILKNPRKEKRSSSDVKSYDSNQTRTMLHSLPRYTLSIQATKYVGFPDSCS